MEDMENRGQPGEKPSQNGERTRRSAGADRRKKQETSFGERVKILLAELLLILKDSWDRFREAAVKAWKAFAAWCRTVWEKLRCALDRKNTPAKPARAEKPAAKETTGVREAPRVKRNVPAEKKPAPSRAPAAHREAVQAVSGQTSGGNTWENIVTVAQMVWVWAYRLRSILLAIPVAVAAITMAIQNMARLPAKVGLELLASGEFEFMVSKSIAVLGPLAVTAVCLLLMFCSRKVLYPWLISIFSLVLPGLIWLTNVFPA